MFQRMISLPVGEHSFFLFGPRQTGKTTLVEKSLGERRVFRINLLETDTLIKYSRDPSLFRREVLFWLKEGVSSISA